MPQFFSRRWNAIGRLALYGGPVPLAALGLAAWLVVRSPGWTGVNDAVEQPVPFPHDVHAGRLGLDCRHCHAGAETEAFAGVPGPDVCMSCHSQVWTGLPALEPVRASYRSGVPLAWKRVHDLPDYSYFHHGIHTQKGVGCVSCHGRIDQMPVIRQTETLQMQWCLDCHREPEQHVRPREEVFNLAWEPPANAADLRAELVEEYGIRRETSCSRCHR